MYWSMWYLYILLCDKKVFYTGITNNLKRRVWEHKNKKSFYTRRFNEINLVYYEQHIDQVEAAKREREIKGWSRQKKTKLIYS